MARAFLDTHVATWLALGDNELSRQALDAINSFSERVISSLTIVEIRIKNEKRGVATPPNLSFGFESAGIAVESFDAEAANALARFSVLQGTDPFDRMLIAQAASVPGTTYFTADRRLLALGFDWIVDVRA
jgi:PIN domain nuclease of toxin-antitoxin system